MLSVYEVVTGWVGRARCRLARRHNVTCRGRDDHTTPAGVIDPDRWTTTWW